MNNRNKIVLRGILLAGMLLGGCSASTSDGDNARGSGANAQAGAAKPARPVHVLTAAAETGDLRVVQNGLGTVVSLGTVTVRSRVDGQLLRILFADGQMVKAGDVLAELDPRPYQAQLDQVRGQAARNQALLKNAQLDLERYKVLRKQDSIAVQQVDAQESLLQQYEGAVLADKGLVDQARLQLDFTRITAPISGRIGLRQVDGGNNITTSDPIAVINQVQPISAIFTVPEDAAPLIVKRLAEAQKAGKPLQVEAWNRGSKALLATGRLLTIDNQIDAATGTVRLKAEFSNQEGTLFPNQFVNVRLLLDTVRGATLIPEAAILQGSSGPFAYVVNADSEANVRLLKLGHAENGKVTVLDGVAVGEQVVINGTDKLRDGAKVAVGSTGPVGNSASAFASRSQAEKASSR